ncbi:hypothetical protein GCM10027612_11890 [Microbispora bryophytorum subsp. camponoti]
MTGTSRVIPPFGSVMVQSRANRAAGGAGIGRRLCHGKVIRGNLRIRGAARSGENDGVTRVVGRQGRVTGRIGPGLVGEVMVPIRGGVEAFYAYPSIPDEEILVGSIVVIVEYSPPRTVYVARAIV